MTDIEHVLMRAYSVIIPAFEERGVIADTIALLRAEFSKLGREAEIIVVDDGSNDGTSETALASGAKVVRNPINSGYGFSLKRGLTEAQHADIVIIDADGTYPIDRLGDLLREYERGYDMVVARRTGKEYRRGLLKYPARLVFTAIAEFAVGRRIPDINSGYRIFRKSIAERFRDDLCNGFSFTTTITLMSMLQGYFVSYVPVPYHPRVGVSKVRHFRDTFRVLQIIVQAILLYNPIKLFLLLSTACVIAALVGLIVAGSAGHWSDGSVFAAIFLSASIVTFALGLVTDVLAKLRLHFIDEKHGK